ncbi:unnamed protein product, partial [Laminaria digitata]
MSSSTERSKRCCVMCREEQSLSEPLAPFTPQHLRRARKWEPGTIDKLKCSLAGGWLKSFIRSTSRPWLMICVPVVYSLVLRMYEYSCVIHTHKYINTHTKAPAFAPLIFGSRSTQSLVMVMSATPDFGRFHTTHIIAPTTCASSEQHEPRTRASSGLGWTSA